MDGMVSFEWWYIRNKYDFIGDLGWLVFDIFFIIRDFWVINYVKDEKWFGVCVVGSYCIFLGGICIFISCLIGKISKIKSYFIL